MSTLRIPLNQNIMARPGWNCVYRNDLLHEEFFIRIEAWGPMGNPLVVDASQRRLVAATDYSRGELIGIVWQKEE